VLEADARNGFVLDLRQVYIDLLRQGVRFDIRFLQDSLTRATESLIGRSCGSRMLVIFLPPSVLRESPLNRPFARGAAWQMRPEFRGTALEWRCTGSGSAFGGLR
jgi:hypothetical protein